MNCRNCGWELSRWAHRCPVCETPRPDRLARLCTWGAYASIIGVALVIIKKIMIG